MSCARRWRLSDRWWRGGGSASRHFVPIPVTDLAGCHQCNAFVADDVVQQGFKVFDAVRNTGDVGMDRDRHDPRVAFAFEIKPVKLIGAALQKLLGRKMLQGM